MSLRSNETGSYTLELACVFLFVNALLILVIQMGMIKYTKEALTFAARKGAEQGGLTGDQGQALTMTYQNIPQVSFVKQPSVQVDNWPAKLYGLVKVTAKAEVPILPIPLLKTLVEDQEVKGTGYYIREKL